MNSGKIKEWAANLFMALFGIIAMACMGLFAYDVWHKVTSPSPVVMTQKEATTPETVEKKVNLTPSESRIITREIERSTDTTPKITYYVTAPTVEGAANKTAEAIRTNSPALPAEATKKTDRTIVTADTDRQKVDVYKITLRKAHKIKTGMTYIDNRAYITAGYQAGRWEGLAYFDWNGRPKGGSVLYTAFEW